MIIILTLYSHGYPGGVLSSLVFKVLDLKHHDEMLYMEAALSFAFPWCEREGKRERDMYIYIYVYTHIHIYIYT